MTKAKIVSRSEWLEARTQLLACSRCGGRMRLVEVAEFRDAVARVLADVGLGPRPPPRPRPVVPGQLDLDLGARAA